MTLLSPGLAPDWKSPLLIRQGSTRAAWLRLRLAGEVVTDDCSAISVNVYRDTSANNLFDSSGALTPAETTEFDVVVPSSESLSLDWIALWSYTYDGVSYEERQRICVVGQIPSSRLDQSDLYDEEPDLRLPARLPQGQTDWSPQILAAWYDILDRMTSRDKKPWLLVDSTDLFHWHKYEALYRCCSAIPSAAGTHYAEAAKRYRAEASRRELTLGVEYEDNTGTHKPVGPGVYRAGAKGRPSW